ncbi:MAG: hypothetical protein ABSF22_01115 [Bryobacteraceae bacterium]
MKKFIPLLSILTIGLWASDFWQSKPYTDWSDKEVQKIQTNSPWSKEVSVSMGEGGSGHSGRGSRAGGGGSVGGDDQIATGAGGSGGGRSQDPSLMGGPSMNLIVSWRTALPVRQAVAKEKYGAEAATSPDAKKLVEEDQKYYGVLVSGLPGRAVRANDQMKAALLKNTSLIVKGKDPIAPADIQTGGNEQKALVIFLFPRTAALSLDDKEVEFSTRFGPLVVRQKFRLKEMVFNGKLEL